MPEPVESGPSSSAPAAAPARSPSERMDRELVHGFLWTAAGRWSVQLFTWGAMVVVARLLSPRDFGICGMAGMYLGLIQTFSEFGFGTAIVTLRNLSDGEIAQVNCVSVLTGVLGVVISMIAAEPLAAFFRTPELRDVVMAMSVTFLIAGFKTVPWALMERDLQFKALSFIRVAQAVGQGVITLVLAFLGFGYWALVLGLIAGPFISTSAVLTQRGRRFALPRLRAIQAPLQFGWNVLVGRICWYCQSNADFLVAGRVLGAAALGSYTIGWNLASVPAEKVSALVGQVMPSIFSAVQDDSAQLRRYLRAMTEAIALPAFPAGIGLALVAPDLVRVFFGAKWMGAVPVLEVLGIYFAINSFGTLIAHVLNALSETRLLMWTGIFSVILMPALFFGASRWGTTGIACGWLVGYPVISAALYWRVFTRIGMSVREYLGALRLPLTSLGPMVMAVLAIRLGAGSWPAAVRLAVEAGAGAGVYGGILWFFHRQRLQAIYRVLRQQRAA